MSVTTKADPIVTVDHAVKHYRRRGRGGLFSAPDVIHAVCGVSLTMSPGTSFGIVGESGSGKSTLLKLVLGLEPLTHGRITFAAGDAEGRSGSVRRSISAVFQDPMTSLNPRMRIRDILREPAHIARRAMPDQQLAELLDMVRLPSDALSRYPHEFSGGQRQRIAIARAISLRPQLILLDEPVSALDVSVQADIIELLRSIRAAFGTAYLMVSHDLAVVAELCDQVGVMWRGHMVETGGTTDVIQAPQHAYTQRLIQAVPYPDPSIQRQRMAQVLDQGLITLPPAPVCAV